MVDTKPPLSVLIVDDSAEIRDIIAAMLKRCGYRVEVAEDGEAGWEQWSLGAFDLLITDQVMPRLLGIDLIRRMRAAGGTHPAIVISGFAPLEEADLTGALAPGTFIAKPFSFLTLLNAVETLLAPLTPRPEQIRKASSSDCER